MLGLQSSRTQHHDTEPLGYRHQFRQGTEQPRPPYSANRMVKIATAAAAIEIMPRMCIQSYRAMP